MNTKLEYLYIGLNNYYQRIIFKIPKLNSFTFSVKLFELFEFTQSIIIWHSGLKTPLFHRVIQYCFAVNRLEYNNQLFSLRYLKSMNNDTLLCPLYVFTAINTNLEPPFRYSLKKFLQVPVHTITKKFHLYSVNIFLFKIAANIYRKWLSLYK